MGVPNSGWLRRENAMKVDDLEVPLSFRKPPYVENLQFEKGGLENVQLWLTSKDYFSTRIWDATRSNRSPTILFEHWHVQDPLQAKW